MKNKKILLFATCSSLLLGGCKITNLITLNGAAAEVVKRDGIIPNSKNPEYGFTCYEICQNDDKKILNVYGKVTDESYNSYLKLCYDNIDFSNYVFSNQADLFASIADIINNYSYSNMENFAVDSFRNFERVFTASIPKTYTEKTTFKDDVYNLSKYVAYNIDDFRYDEKTSQIQFNSDIVAEYKNTKTDLDYVIVGGRPTVRTTSNTEYKNINYTFDVKYNIPQDVYANCNNDSKKLIGVLEDYVKNGLTNEYTITESEKPFTYNLNNKNNTAENQQKIEDEGMIF